MSKGGKPDHLRPTRKVVGLRILERKKGSDSPNVVFQFAFPEVDPNVTLFTRKELEDAIDRLPDVSDVAKLAAKNRIWFALDLWFPNHFYEIGKVDWKY